MTITRHPLPDGELFAVSDRLIIVERTESVAVAGITIGQPGAQLAVHVTFQGRLNNSTDDADVTIAISPLDALQVINTLMDTLDLIASAQTKDPNS